MTITTTVNKQNFTRLVSKFFFLATWWAGYYFPSKMLCRIFFSLLISLQDFFSLKTCRVYIYIHIAKTLYFNRKLLHENASVEKIKNERIIFLCLIKLDK